MFVAVLIGTIIYLLATVVEGDRRLHFQLVLYWGIGEDASPFPGLLHFTHDAGLVLLRFKQGASSTIFIVFGMRWPGIGEHFTHLTKRTG